MVWVEKLIGRKEKRERKREKGKGRNEKGELHRPTEGIVCGPSKDLELGLGLGLG